MKVLFCMLGFGLAVYTGVITWRQFDLFLSQAQRLYMSAVTKSFYRLFWSCVTVPVAWIVYMFVFYAIFPFWFK